MCVLGVLAFRLEVVSGVFVAVGWLVCLVFLSWASVGTSRSGTLGFRRGGLLLRFRVAGLLVRFLAFPSGFFLPREAFLGVSVRGAVIPLELLRVDIGMVAVLLVSRCYVLTRQFFVIVQLLFFVGV